MFSSAIGAGHSKVSLHAVQARRPDHGRNFVVKAGFCSHHPGTLRQDTGRGADSDRPRFRRSIVITAAAKPWSRWFGGKDRGNNENKTEDKSPDVVSSEEAVTEIAEGLGDPNAVQAAEAASEALKEATVVAEGGAESAGAAKPSPLNSVDRAWEEGVEQDPNWDATQPTKGDPLGYALMLLTLLGALWLTTSLFCLAGRVRSRYLLAQKGPPAPARISDQTLDSDEDIDHAEAEARALQEDKAAQDRQRREESSGYTPEELHSLRVAGGAHREVDAHDQGDSGYSADAEYTDGEESAEPYTSQPSRSSEPYTSEPSRSIEAPKGAAGTSKEAAGTSKEAEKPSKEAGGTTSEGFDPTTVAPGENPIEGRQEGAAPSGGAARVIHTGSEGTPAVSLGEGSGREAQGNENDAQLVSAGTPEGRQEEGLEDTAEPSGRDAPAKEKASKDDGLGNWQSGWPRWATFAQDEANDRSHPAVPPLPDLRGQAHVERAVDPGTLQLPSDTSVASLRQRASVARRAALAASDASQRASAYSAAAASAASKAAEHAERAASAATSAQNAFDRRSEEALSAAEARVEAAETAAREAEQRTASAAAMATAHEEVSSSQAAVAEKAAELPQASGPGPLAGVRRRVAGVWYAAQDGAALAGRSVLSWFSGVGVWAQGLWVWWCHNTAAMWQATGDAVGRVWLGLLAVLKRVWAGVQGLWTRLSERVASLAQRGQTPV